MADKMLLNIKDENENHQEENEHCCTPLQHGVTEYDVKLKTELKQEMESSFESDDSVKSEEFHIKTEEIDVSDMEFPVESDDESENEPPRMEQIAGDVISGPKSTEDAACSPIFPMSLCQPCFVLLERIDSTAGANPVVFSCSLCKFGFTSMIRRDRHQRLSCRLRRFDEPVRKGLACVAPQPEKIPAAFELGTTLNKQAPKGKKILKCGDCSFSTDRSSHFRRHMVTHTGARNFACTQCEYKATQKASLAQHLLTHGDIKPYACTVCNYRSVQKGNLMVHMRLHSGDKPFKCTQCDYACKMSNDLANHVRGKHTKERPYACTRCECTFVTSSTLARHIFTHTGEKKLACSECTYKCNRSSDMKKHVAAKHKG